MAFLTRFKKEDLLELADELGEEIPVLCKVVEMRKIILRSEYYNEEEVKGSLERIQDERNRREQEEKDDKRRREQEEKDERNRREQEEKDDKRRREQEEKDERNRREEREHELNMKRLESREDTPEQTEVNGRSSIPKFQLINLIPKFDEKRDEMGLYLINFERRAEMARIPQEDWVAYLLNVLPPEISNMMAREIPENANEYEFVKRLILNRFKLNAEKLRQLFYGHQKTAEKSWRNFAHELSSYFHEWLTELDVTTFQQLKELIVTDQLKRRAPDEVREHFLKEWMNFKSPSELAEKIDNFESLRESFKQNKFSVASKVKPTSWLSERNNSYQQREDNERNQGKYFSKGKFQEKEFERRKQPQCYECGSYSHLRPQCPQLKKNVEMIASIEILENEQTKLLNPYMSVGKVNGIEMPILRDTGATLDLVCQKFIKAHMLTGECVRIRTPFEESSICLPLAEIEIECDMGHVITKAAVLRDSLDRGRYLLGNRTALLFEKMKSDDAVERNALNAVETRAQVKLKEAPQKSEEENWKYEEEGTENPPVDEVEDTLPLDEETAGENAIETFAEDLKRCHHQRDESKSMIEVANDSSGRKSCLSVEQLLDKAETDYRQTSFVSSLTTEFRNEFDIKLNHSSVQHPQSNPVEMFNLALKRILRIFCVDSGPDWERHIPGALFALRTLVHDSIGFSPTKLTHDSIGFSPTKLAHDGIGFSSTKLAQVSPQPN